jgi:hypothetical protein
VRGEIATRRRVRGVVVVVVAVQTHFQGRVGTDDDRVVARAVGAAHPVVLVGAVPSGRGVRRVELDGAERVPHLVGGDLGGQGVVPAALVDAGVVGTTVVQVALTWAVVPVDGAESAVDGGFHEQQILAVDSVVAQRLQGADRVAERDQTGRAELNVEHRDLAPGVCHVPDVPRATRLLRAGVVHGVDLGRHGAKLGQERGQPVRARRVHIHQLHPVAGPSVAFAEHSGGGERPRGASRCGTGPAYIRPRRCRVRTGGAQVRHLDHRVTARAPPASCRPQAVVDQPQRGLAVAGPNVRGGAAGAGDAGTGELSVGDAGISKPSRRDGGGDERDHADCADARPHRPPLTCAAKCRLILAARD